MKQAIYKFLVGMGVICVVKMISFTFLGGMVAGAITVMCWKWIDETEE